MSPMVSNRDNFICHDEHFCSQLKTPKEVFAIVCGEHIEVLLVVALLVELAAEEGVLEEERVR